MMQRLPVDYVERCYAGWLGKVIGVRHGAPIEGWSYGEIRKQLGEITDYPAEYHDFAADDDTNGPLFFLRALTDYGLDATAEQIGLTWLNYAPYQHGFYWWGGYGASTEHTAYLNLRAGIPAPRSGSVEQNGAAVAEQIGGQIFIDTWGLISPGNPEMAASYAQRAASVSHGGNGIYGGQVVAAAIAAAFVEHDIEKVLQTAFKQIPQDCEYMCMANDIVAFYHAHADDDWRECMEYIIANWGYARYPGACHIIPNSAVMIMSMLYGKGDFSRTINICNMAGWDTDCNVGNVGTIMGVLVGLEGIEPRWRKPVNDFLVSSSVVGCLNIMNLPEGVRYICNLGYAIAEDSVPEKWQDFLKGERTLDFSLPGATYAMRMSDPKDRLFGDSEVFESGNGSLRCVLTGMGRQATKQVYFGTYYRPKDFTDSRYDPAFSPLFYPGQTITARVMTDGEYPISVQAFAHDDNHNHIYKSDSIRLVPKQWTTVSVTVPPIDGGLIDKVGVEVCGLAGNGWDRTTLYIDYLDISGKANYSIDYGKECNERWTLWHKEVSQMTYLKGIWEIQNGRLMGTCCDFGESYTGNIAWKDVEVSCCFTRNTNAGETGFTFRTQGAIRGYAVFVDDNGVSLMKNANGYTTLCRYDASMPADIALTVRCVKNALSVWLDGRCILQTTDDTYANGMVGLALKNGGHALFDRLTVTEL